MSDDIGRKKRRIMKAVLIIPIESLRGKLREDGYYFRDTPARKAARERFVEKYGKKKARN